MCLTLPSLSYRIHIHSNTFYRQLDADPYIPGGGGAQWFVNQNNFFRSVRNFVIDLRQMPPSASATGLHWQVSQATSLMNIRVEMSTEAGNNHQGAFWTRGMVGQNSLFRGIWRKSLEAISPSWTRQDRSLEIPNSVDLPISLQRLWPRSRCSVPNVFWKFKKTSNWRHFLSWLYLFHPKRNFYGEWQRRIYGRWDPPLFFIPE